jgi:hypothetical protein
MRADRLAKSRHSKRRRTSSRRRRLSRESLESRMLLAQTTGLFFNDPGTADGYVLFSPNTTGTTYLMDKDANIVKQWQSSYGPGLLGYLLEDGSLLRAAALHPINSNNGAITAAGGGGKLERFDWEGNKNWEFIYDSAGPTTSDVHWAHHDFEVMPNGNILMIAWEKKDETDATAAGRDPSLPGPGYLYPDHIIEVQPDFENGGGTIVWQWHVWDHLVQDFDATKANYSATGIAAHPELIDVNYVSTFDVGGGAGEDWNHANGIEYNPELDQILLSVREFSEFWIIDHSTTMTEAAGHTGGDSGKGGDLLYRWGNPQAYGRGDASDRVLYYQHDARWVEDDLSTAGHITVFNNGYGGPANPDVSSIEEIVPPVDEMGNYPALAPGEAYGPESTFWTYTGPQEKFSTIISGAKRLRNGNTLITYGVNGTFSEVTPAGVEVWKYVNPYTSGGVLGPEDPIPNLGILIPGLDSLLTNFVFQAQHYAPGFAPQIPASVVGRHLFYNQSGFDGNSAAIDGPADNSAVAPDKSAYIPNGVITTFTNVTSYSRGINGIMVDITGSHPSITTADFIFKVGNDNTPSSWTTAPAPASLVVISTGGVSGSDRVEITWASGAIRNKWLEVQVLATGDTGLASPDVFFWGNRIGDSGTSTPATTFSTTSVDTAQTNASQTGTLNITNLRDFNRLAGVTSIDTAIANANQGNIRRINIPAIGPFAPAGADEGDGDGGGSAIASALAAASVGPAASSEPVARIDGPVSLRELDSTPVRGSQPPTNEVPDKRAAAIVSTPDWLVETLDLDDWFPRRLK